MCDKCGKAIDTSKYYSLFCYEVGDRDNKTISNKQIKEWDSIEDTRAVKFCFECTNILDDAEKKIEELKKLKKEFYKLLV